MISSFQRLGCSAITISVPWFAKRLEEIHFMDSSRILHFVPAQTSMHTAWMVVKYHGVLKDFQENILASGKVLFVSL